MLSMFAGGGAALTVGSPVTLNAGVVNTMESPDQALTLSGAISGAGGFTKTGANALLLTATNTMKARRSSARAASTSATA